MKSDRKPTAIVFGAGNGYKHHYQAIHRDFDVLAVVANHRIGEDVCGMEIMPPSILNQYDYDYVLVTPVGQNSLKIKDQLKRMGIPPEKMRFNEYAGIEPYTIDPLFFAEDLCDSQKKHLFASNVERVVLELNSKCNRKCWFCTNTYVDMCPDNVDMSDEVFEKIVRELAEIDYDQDICLSFFNEPLLCTKLMERIKELKERLPKSFVYLFTNGDYLDKEKIDRLEKAGLDILFIDIYTNKIEFDVEEVYQKALQLMDRVQLSSLSASTRKSECGLLISKRYGSMDIEIASNNFSQMASNRGEALPDYLPIPKIASHPLLCVKTFISYHIDFRGNVWPCPNYHREYTPHQEFCLGNILDESMFDIYLGKNIMSYREKHFFHRSSLPCRSCIWNVPTFKNTNRFHRPFRNRPKYSRRDVSDSCCGSE